MYSDTNIWKVQNIEMFALQATDGGKPEKDAGASGPDPSSTQAGRHSQETQRECR